MEKYCTMLEQKRHLQMQASNGYVFELLKSIIGRQERIGNEDFNFNVPIQIDGKECYLSLRGLIAALEITIDGDKTREYPTSV